MFATNKDTGRIEYLQAIKQKDCPLWFHTRGLSETASGYGSKLTSRTMVRTEQSGPWRRVYVACFSNAGTTYVVIKGKRYAIAGV